MPKVKSFRSVGKQQAFDLEVKHPDHQFYLANGLLTSNSHALSYAIDSYQCAWLLTYYEPEWLCAYMETQAGQPDKRSKAISELKSFGYEIVGVDINLATDQWTILPDKKFMPSFLTVKGIGQAAVEEIELYRPYRTVEDLLWNPDGSWRHSKFNKRAFESLIKIRAFSSMDLVGPGKKFPSYRAMHTALIVDNAKIKHVKKGRAELASRLEAVKDTCEWSKPELIAFSKDLVGSFDLDLVVSRRVRDKLEEINVTSIDDYDPERPVQICWFICEDTQIKKTRNGRDYMLMIVTGPAGKRHRIYVWSYDADKYAIAANEVYVGELGVSPSFTGGFQTNPWKLKSVNQRKEKEKL